MEARRGAYEEEAGQQQKWCGRQHRQHRADRSET
jgi:hypothetical protein